MINTNIFDNWDDIPVIKLETMDRQIYTGEKVMLVRNTIHPRAVIPNHAHPHEQITYVVSGECDVTTAGETRRVGPGGLSWFASDEEHEVVNTLDEPLVVIDIFAPIREDFI